MTLVVDISDPTGVLQGRQDRLVLVRIIDTTLKVDIPLIDCDGGVLKPGVAR